MLRLVHLRARAHGEGAHALTRPDHSASGERRRRGQQAAGLIERAGRAHPVWIGRTAPSVSVSVSSAACASVTAVLPRRARLRSDVRSLLARGGACAPSGTSSSAVHATINAAARRSASADGQHEAGL